MRILSITAQKPNSTGSGVYLTELVNGFAKMGHEQAVIAGIRAGERAGLPEGVQFFPVCFETEELPFPVAGMSDEMPYNSTRYSDMTEEMTMQFRAAFSKTIKATVARFQPDVILCHHLYYVTALARELCPKCRVYGLSHGSDLRQIQKNAWQRDYMINGIRNLDGIFALHSKQKEQIRSVFGCRSGQIVTVGVGYNSDIFRFLGKENKREKKRLIFAGKLSEKKGIFSLFRAMEYLEHAKEDYELVLAGGYATEKEYEQILVSASKCPCDVKFLGRISQAELAEEMNDSDIFILPSFYEGLPLVVIEALACGLQVVCTDLPGIWEWLGEFGLDEGVCFVTPPKMRNQDEPIIEALPQFEKELADAIERAGKRQGNVLSKVKRVTWSNICGKLCETWSGSDTKRIQL